MPSNVGLFQALGAFFAHDQADKFFRALVPAWLVRHRDKGLAIFDTGLRLRFRMKIEKQLEPGKVSFEFFEIDELAARMKLAGIDPAEVRWVINSHLHADHCGGNASLPNATIVIQRREWEFARNNCDGKTYDPGDFDTGQPVLQVEAEHDLFGDGTPVVFPTYGHTPGHQSARVRLVSGEVVLTSDCCYLRHNLETLAVPASNVDKEASHKFLRWLQRQHSRGVRVMFGHDAEQWWHVPQEQPIR